MQTDDYVVRNGNPAKQGLKRCNNEDCIPMELVRNGNPAKQGLKLSILRRLPRTPPVRNGNPAKQGLKLTIIAVIIIAAAGPKRKSSKTRIETKGGFAVASGAYQSETEIQQNKD